MIEYKTAKTELKTADGTVIGERRREEEIFTAPAPITAPVLAPTRVPTPLPPAPQLSNYPPNPPQQVVQQITYTSPPVPPPAPYVPASEPVTMPHVVSPTHENLSIQIREVSPPHNFAPTYTPTPYSSVEAASMALIPSTAHRPEVMPMIYDGGSPAMNFPEQAAHDPLALVATDSDRMRVRIRSKSHSRHRSRHRRHRSHSTHHGSGDGALFARFHSSRDRDRYDISVDDRYYYDAHDHYEPVSTGRELMRTERLSTGELVLYQDEMDRFVEPRGGVRIEKDRKGRMAISVPKYR